MDMDDVISQTTPLRLENSTPCLDCSYRRKQPCTNNNPSSNSEYKKLSAQCSNFTIFILVRPRDGLETDFVTSSSVHEQRALIFHQKKAATWKE
ncbi:hypothetical protein RRG08_004306 [Elysia crispata]|uniref:Uncharacterized protein n=1 Tax=Elysia crispata TaxID=231223 RepID=A0AAE0YC89_9GAST|nr:hypothetical protein RRG08_004306 [Elysia crispata]